MEINTKSYNIIENAFSVSILNYSKIWNQPNKAIINWELLWKCEFFLFYTMVVDISMCIQSARTIIVTVHTTKNFHSLFCRIQSVIDNKRIKDSNYGIKKIKLVWLLNKLKFIALINEAKCPCFENFIISKNLQWH